MAQKLGRFIWIGRQMYILEGNIGVGKSTFLKLLGQYCPEITVIQEPQDNWASHEQGQSLLENFYKDPRRWAYTLETLAMVSRVKDHTFHQMPSDPNRLMERSVYSGHYCFAQNDYDSGYLSELEWEVYSRWVDFLVHKSCTPPRGFIYLRANPEACFERVKKRNRHGEESVSLDYIKRIHFWHDKFLLEKSGVAYNLAQVPVLTLDANYDLINDQVCLKNYLTQVKDFLRQTQLSQHYQPAEKFVASAK
jgi:deoxyadenosine/deoxycytidine kinase